MSKGMVRFWSSATEWRSSALPTGHGKGPLFRFVGLSENRRSRICLNLRVNPHIGSIQKRILGVSPIFRHTHMPMWKAGVRVHVCRTISAGVRQGWPNPHAFLIKEWACSWVLTATQNVKWLVDLKHFLCSSFCWQHDPHTESTNPKDRISYCDQTVVRTPPLQRRWYNCLQK